MTEECLTKTITEVKDGLCVIKCVSLANQDGEPERPTIFRTDIPDKPISINRVSGKEGELLITHTDTNENVGVINENGELILNLDEDVADKYRINRQTGELEYDE